MVDLKVFVEGDLVTDDGLGRVDPGIGYMREDLLLEVGVDTSFIVERDILGIPEFAVGLVAPITTTHLEVPVAGGGCFVKQSALTKLPNVEV